MDNLLSGVMLPFPSVTSESYDTDLWTNTFPGFDFSIIIYIIHFALIFFSVVAFCQIILSYFEHMNHGGNDEEYGRIKNTFVRSLVVLVLLMSAYPFVKHYLQPKTGDLPEADNSIVVYYEF